MIASLAALALTVLSTTATDSRTDTTFAVQPGARLEVNAFAGSISVVAWSRNSIRVGADHSSQSWIVVQNKGNVIALAARHRRGIPTTVEYQITVPKWLSVDLTGVNTDMSVENTEGEISVETVQGDVDITGGTRIVKANSVEGDVHVFKASGKIEANSVNADVRLEKCSGLILASSINGEVTMKEIASDDVEASTINGEVTYEGQVKDGGSYRFTSHDGTVSMVMPERSNATVSVATYTGDFTTTFPVQINETRPGKRFNFTLGNGSAKIDLASFQGSIRVRRPGDPEQSGHGYKYDYSYKEHQKTKEKHKTEKHDKNDDSDDDDEGP
jgi:DUF4097 and DUF4098 domain-containing protein YvlB